MQPAAVPIAQRQIATIRGGAHALAREMSCSDEWCDVGARLSELLDAIAEAWQSASDGPDRASMAEQLRWTPVCVVAARIAERR